MFLSIGVPIFNKEKYIDRLIESVMNQTERDFELILINDGSTDCSLEICKKWQNNYPEHITVIDKPNEGSLLTRRRCIKEARGSYMYIIDADDYLVDKSVLSRAKDIINLYKCDLLFFDITVNNNLTPYFQYPFHNMEVFEGEKLHELYKIAVKNDSLNSLCNKIFSRNIVDWDDESYKYAHITNGTDMYQSIPIIFNSRRALFWKKVAYYYQINDNESSISHSFNRRIYYSLKLNYCRLGSYCKKRNVDEEITSLLDKRWLLFVGTSVYKARLQRDRKERIAYIKNIGEDKFFRNHFLLKTLKDVPLNRSILPLLLYLKQYHMLSIILTIVRR